MSAPAPRRLAKLLISLCALLAFCGFVALGNWQLERRVWKLDLIERVNERAHAAPQAAPKQSQWPQISQEADEYRKLSLQGQFLADRDTLVVGASELGSGYWVMTPFRSESGGLILVNRGFINQGVTPTPAPSNNVEVTGLLRISEPNGSVLRDNQPSQNRWYSRDTQAIGQAQDLQLAPYFIDAAANQPGSPGAPGPTGGLTIIQFHNSHLVYAITWYGLALMVIGAAVLVKREQGRRDKRA
jgi:surfeit locus 1 family protein